MTAHSFTSRFGVVLLLSLVALVGQACAGAASSIGDGSGDGGGAGRDATAEDAANASGCPAAAPASGTSCGASKLTCSYGCDTEAKCEAAQWRVVKDSAKCPPTGVFACGATTCLPSQLCVAPCCGGPAPPCTPKPEGGGACPPGTHAGTCPSGDQGCQTDSCVPPPPFCVDSASDPRASGCLKGVNDPRQLSCLCA